MIINTFRLKFSGMKLKTIWAVLICSIALSAKSQSPIATVIEADVVHNIPKNIKSIEKLYYLENRDSTKSVDTIININNEPKSLVLDQTVFTDYSNTNIINKKTLFANGEVFDSTRLEFSATGKLIKSDKWDFNRKITY